MRSEGEVAMKLEPDLHSGTLSDQHIRQAAEQGFLISEEFDDACIRQACYELRAGSAYYELSRADRNTTPIRHELKQGEYILLKPKQFITIITKESLRLPTNVLGRVLTKGQLFSIGVIPVNTYADPGFEGRLGIVLANLSNNYLKIEQSEAIAKIEFSKLRQPVSIAYDGQHGYQSKMWPIPTHMILTPEEAARDVRVKGGLDELELLYGALIANVMRRVLRFERRLIFASIGYITLSTVVLAILAVRHDAGFTFSTVLSVILGVVSNIFFAVLVYLATSIRH
jgi:dCTP deaminase